MLAQSPHMRLHTILTIFLASLTAIALSQEQKPYGEFTNSQTRKIEKNLLKDARKEFDFGNYDQAQAKYAELLKLDSANPMYNFEQAQTLYNNYRQPQSIKYYENAIKYSKDSLGEAYYFLASAYHINSQFDLAEKNYRNYLRILIYHGTDMMEDEEQELKDEINRKIEMCANGKQLMEAPVVEKFQLNGKLRPFRINSAGKGVNSEFDDYGAVLSANDSVMYFTARREATTGGKVDWDDKFFEDIYTSALGKEGWGMATQIGEPVNSAKHEAVLGVTADGKTLYFYRGIKQGTFYYSKLEGNVWSKPKILYENTDLNTAAWETSFFGFTIAGSELYVVSDREGGMGGRDIYVAKKQPDGSWGKLENMGAPINTKYDEDAPFVTSDGNTMYFSSKGHNSMGGFDIFRSQRDADKWAPPENLGRPFNTPGEDIYFILANKNERAYYSSSSYDTDGTKDMEIYMVDFCDDVDEIMLAGTAVGMEGGSVSIVEKGSGQKLGEYPISDGRYSARVKHGMDYRFTFSTGSGYEPVSADVSVPRLCKVYDLYQELNLSQSSLLVKNAFFDIKKEAGSGNYSDYLAGLDKASQPLYSEINLPLSAVVVTSTVVPTPTVAVSTPTVIASTPTVAVSTPTVIASTPTVVPTPTVTASTPTLSTSPEPPDFAVGNVSFDYDRSSIGGGRSELDRLADYLKKYKSVKVEITGYTDSRGSDEYNTALSKRRADAVASYLASKGISRSRITAVGNGEAKPIAPNENPDGSDNPEGRAKNRRTEITILK